MGFKRRPPRQPTRLADEWRLWTVENLLAGVTPDDIAATLIDSGVPPALARREIDAIVDSPALAACRLLDARARRLAMLSELPRRLARDATRPTEIERRPMVTAAELYDRYWARSEPVILTELTRDWPARNWTPAALAERFGDVDIEACLGRGGAAEPDMNWEDHRQTLPLAELFDRVGAAGVSNDIYVIAHNRAIERPELAPLLGDVRVDPDLFDPTDHASAMSLWIGPAGTVTPLHHDTTNIAFNQLYGRKRFRLVPPWETALLDGARGFYAGSRVDELAARNPHLLIKEVVLEPGESLFLPIGWWHEVEALDVSISLSLLCFRRPNAFDWYRPGLVTGA